MIESVWIEIRPVLRSCHICIVFKKKFDFSIKVKIKKSEIVIENSGKLCSVAFEDFVLEPLTAGGFNVKNNLFCFRIQVECNVNVPKKSHLNITPAVANCTNLYCKCFNSLTKETKFKRILPLPNTDCNMADMFCHFKGTTESFGNLFPKIDDCFYSNNNIIVNEELVVNCTKKKKFYKCNRCLNTVGISKNKSVQFWLSNLELSHLNKTLSEILLFFIQKAISESLSMFPQILMESEEVSCYLLIIVVDKNLILSMCSNNLKLSTKQVVKVKYKYYTHMDQEIKSVKNEQFGTLSHILVPNNFLEFTLKYLVENSEKIPTIFSKMENDNAVMTYLNL